MEHKLEDLFVVPEARNIGVGKAFFAELAKVAEEKVTCILLYPLNSLQTSHVRIVPVLIGQC